MSLKVFKRSKYFIYLHLFKNFGLSSFLYYFLWNVPFLLQNTQTIYLRLEKKNIFFPFIDLQKLSSFFFFLLRKRITVKNSPMLYQNRIFFWFIYNIKPYIIDNTRVWCSERNSISCNNMNWSLIQKSISFFFFCKDNILYLFMYY